MAKSATKKKAAKAPSGDVGKKGRWGQYRLLSSGEHGFGLNGYGIRPPAPDVAGAAVGAYLQELAGELGTLEGTVAAQGSIDWDQIEPDDHARLAWMGMYRRELDKILATLAKRKGTTLASRDEIHAELLAPYLAAFLAAFRN